MLRRKQIMITDWLDDYLTAISKRYDISYSEVIRIATSFFFAETLCLAYPKKYKLNISAKDISKVLKHMAENEDYIEESRKLISDVYYETKNILKDRVKQIGASLNNNSA